MKEIWKKIEGFEDYEISSTGRVKSLSREICNIRRCYISKDKILKPYLGSRGYYTVSINGRPKSIHVLVAIAFLGHKSCGAELVVDHIDNNKINNNLNNLQIVTTRVNSTKDRKNKTNSSCVFINHKQYSVRMVIEGVNKHLGNFKTVEKAELYYKQCLDRINKGLYPIKTKPKRSSEFEGVTWHKKNFRWQVQYKKKYIGSFIFEDDARKALEIYKKQLIKLI